MSIFQNAITEADGKSVNVGYLALFWVLIVVLNTIPVLIALSGVEMYLNEKHTFNVKDLGIAIGAVCTGFAAALGALGVFLWGDRRPEPKAK